MDFSLQLYSARNFPPLDPLLSRLAELGYGQVEGYGALYSDSEALDESLVRHGLLMPTAHFGLDQLRDTASAMSVAGRLGIRTLYCPAIPKEDREQPEEKWVELAETLGALGEVYRRNGFTFGWHNHDFEFRPTASGRLPMEILLETASDIEWQMDVAWVVKGGHDPVAWMEKYGPRISSIHIKDIAPAGQAEDEDGWADVGYGILDWRGLFDAARNLTQSAYFVMEHDNPSNVERFAARSLAAARTWT